MPMIDMNPMYQALRDHLDALELETKTPGLKGDMLDVAKKVYDLLQARLREEKEIDPDLINLTLNCVQGRFYSPFGVAKDLKQWIQNPIDPNPRNLIWYDLCVGNIKQI